MKPRLVPGFNLLLRLHSKPEGWLNVSSRPKTGCFSAPIDGRKMRPAPIYPF